jgi:hypothetical protein
LRQHLIGNSTHAFADLGLSRQPQASPISAFHCP